MSTLPYCAKQSAAMANHEYVPCTDDGLEGLRDACEKTVTEDETFWHYGELSQRLQASLMKALRDGDTRENNEIVGRIIRAAFDRAVNEAVEFKVSRLQAEAMIEAERD